MIVTETFSDWNESFQIPLQNILLYDEENNNLYSPNYGVLKTLKNPVGSHFNDLTSDNTIYIDGMELFDKNNYVQKTIVIEQEMNQSNFRVIEPKIKLFAYNNNIILENVIFSINNFNFKYGELTKTPILNDQIILDPIIINSNKLEININIPVAFVLIDCYI